MSEPKRVHFEANGIKKLSTDSSAVGEPRKTVRLELDLSTDGDYPEFNYLDLITAEKKKKKIPQLNGFGDPFEPNDNDMRIAQEFERKYGNAYKASGSNKRRLNTSIHDKGSGYDQNDPFIDDAIKYDENVPDEMETHHGGFYINCGPLQFKKLENFERPEDALRMPKPRKRIVSTDSSDSNGSVDDAKSKTNTELPKNGQPEKKVKMINNKEKNVIATKPKTKPTEDGATKKDATAIKTTTVKEMLRIQRDKTIAANGLKTSGQATTTTEDSSSSSSGTSEFSDDDNVPNVGDTERVIEKNPEESPPIGVAGPSVVTPPVPVPVPVIETNGKSSGTEPVLLPENLPNDLLQKIKYLEELVKTKPKPFADVESLTALHEIDVLARKSNVQKIIFNYLAANVGCSYNLMNSKARKLRDAREERSIKPWFERLKGGINEVMPRALELYEQSCRAVAEQKANRDPSKPDPKIKNPRRKFPWDKFARESMEEIVKIKREAFKLKLIRGQKDWEYIDKYFIEHLVPLWPPQWMKVDELRREFLREAIPKPKEHRKSTDKIPNVKNSTGETAATAKKSKPPATARDAPANLLNAIDMVINDILMPSETSISKTEKKSGDSLLKTSPTAVITSVSLVPTEEPNGPTSSTSTKTIKSTSNQPVIMHSTAPMSTKASNMLFDNTIEITSSPEHTSRSPHKKAASNHSINHIISAMPPNPSTSPKSTSSTTSTQLKSPSSTATLSTTHSDGRKATLHSNIVSNQSKSVTPDLNRAVVTSSPKSVLVIKDSSSEDEIQFVDHKPKRVSFDDNPKRILYDDSGRKMSLPMASAAAAKLKRDKIKTTRDPMVDDEDNRYIDTTMNALKELQPGSVN